MRLFRCLMLLVTAAYWAFLCVMTHLPPQNLPHVEVDDKLQHFLAYAMLAGLMGLTFWSLFPRRKWLVWAVLVIGLVYGAIDEQTQTLVGRTADLEDWISDAVGTMAGILPVALLQRFVRLPDGSAKPEVVTGEVVDDVLSPELDAALDAAARRPV